MKYFLAVSILLLIFPNAYSNSCQSAIGFFMGSVKRNIISYNNHILGNYKHLTDLATFQSKDLILTSANSISISELIKMGIEPAHWTSTRGHWINDDIFNTNGIEITQKMLPHPKPNAINALEHPEISSYLHNLNKRGYRLVIDPSLAIARHYGALWGKSKTIAILPHTPWEVFLHEYEHSLFRDLMLNEGISGIRLLEIFNHSAKKKVNIVNYLRDNYGFTSNQAKYLIKVSKDKRWSDQTLNESLAVNREIKAIKAAGKSPFSFVLYRARKYRWKFQLKDLNDLEYLELPDKIKRFEIKLKKILLHPFALNGSLVISYIIFMDEINGAIIKFTNGMTYFIEND